MDEGTTAIIIVFWDGMSFIWESFFHFFFKYWPDCKFPIYLGSNIKVYEHLRVTPLLVGEEKSYSSNLKTMLSNVSYKNVLLIMDDFFISDRVDSKFINEIIRISTEENTIYINFVVQKHEITSFYPRYFKDQRFSVIPPGFPYRVTLGAGLWNREALLSILEDGRSAWEIERIGSSKSNGLNNLFLCVSDRNFENPPIKTVNALQDGVWTREFIDFISKSGIESTFLKFREQRKFPNSIILKLYEVLRFNSIKVLYTIFGRGFMIKLAIFISKKKKSFQN